MNRPSAAARSAAAARPAPTARSAPGASAEPGGRGTSARGAAWHAADGLIRAVHAEWTKLATLPGTGWLLAAVVVLTAGTGAAADAATRCAAGSPCTVDPARLALAGVQLGQAVVAILAVLVIAGEYSTGMIRVTLTAMPRRPVLLGAKAVVTGGVTLVAAVLAVAGSLLAARLILPGHGFAVPSPAHGPVLRALAGSVLYLALIGLLSLGVAAAIRDTAVAIGTVLGLLYLAPIMVHLLISSPIWSRRLERYMPTQAGLNIQATTGLHGLAITPWAGLGVLALWALAALLGGGLVLHLRDA
jgi:ABC-2 type transport system permease protein